MNEQPLVEFTSGDSVALARVKTDTIVEDDSIHDFQKELKTYVDIHPGTALYLDLSRVRFFSSAVLTGLLQIQQALTQSNGCLRLYGVHGNVQTILKLTGMDKTLNVERSRVRLRTRKAVPAA